MDQGTSAAPPAARGTSAFAGQSQKSPDHALDARANRPPLLPVHSGFPNR